MLKKVFGIRGICISEEKLPSYTYIYLTLPLSSSHLIHSQFTKKHTLIKTVECAMTRLYPTAMAESPEKVDDSLFILAALLYALVCVVGLIAVAVSYCFWHQRRSMDSRTPSQPSATNKQIEKKFLEALLKFAYHSAKQEKHGNCAICLKEYVDGDEIRVLPQCGHGFHIGCIDKWLDSHLSCLSCRPLANLELLVIGKCKKCGGFKTTTAGNISLEITSNGVRIT
ncbi:putative transcription factor C2H2 family [Helianthus annuus]|uniref:Putative zinc finger, RING/FYVE/PHD-type n=2 Tax=Helianthus annuus TaxID=4232 RepID=A0A251T6Y5_HELAN|nr:putative transcription factor C2H2 family [Helianthus annuus]KAJ0451792.1 putative transcription factor C2H2 family [Helianthus annuus]KAJ0456469.1 putative transcription factor C2H2 family [Helianthus annuus]KAJ0473681.1 putative transcription factor C2H2 family [Helianthus annuus]KAJ0649258.1 putative transcription factor C2H2 family [Helianthus annuus]